MSSWAGSSLALYTGVLLQLLPRPALLLARSFRSSRTPLMSADKPPIHSFHTIQSSHKTSRHITKSPPSIVYGLARPPRRTVEVFELLTIRPPVPRQTTLCQPSPAAKKLSDRGRRPGVEPGAKEQTKAKTGTDIAAKQGPKTGMSTNAVLKDGAAEVDFTDDNVDTATGGLYKPFEDDAKEGNESQQIREDACFGEMTEFSPEMFPFSTEGDLSECHPDGEWNHYPCQGEDDENGILKRNVSLHTQANASIHNQGVHSFETTTGNSTPFAVSAVQGRTPNPSPVGIAWGTLQDKTPEISDADIEDDRYPVFDAPTEENIRGFHNEGNLHRERTATMTSQMSGADKCPFFATDSDQEQEDQKTPPESDDDIDWGSQGGPEGDVILVTGGAGFLGRHVIRLLQERGDYVKEIRVLDLVPFLPQRDDPPGQKEVTSIVGSVTDEETVRRACKGANCVIHIAGLVSYGTFPDTQGMKEVNVDGTLTVIKACIRESVARLLFCSTVDVVIGFKDIEGGTEELPPPDVFLFPGYPFTKFRAESLVLLAHGQSLDNGGRLRTLALRANVMYGEGDPYYVINGLQAAKGCGGYLFPVEGLRSAIFQASYAGNTAWAFLCADRALRDRARVGGQPFFVPDNTPLSSTFAFLAPYLASQDLRLAPVTLPFRPLYWMLRVVEAVLRLLAPWKQVQLSTTSHSLKYITMRLWFRGDRAHSLLGYRPLYSPQESRVRSLAYYSKLKL